MSTLSVNHGKIKPCTVLGFAEYEIWFNGDHYKVALHKYIDDVQDAIGKSPVMKLTDVLDGAWTRYKNISVKTVIAQHDELLHENQKGVSAANTENMT